MTEHRLGMGDAGRTLEVAAGDRLVVALPETAGTGYTWSVEALPPGTRVVEERYDQRPGVGIGGASEHVFVLEAPADAGTVRLRHARAWEGADGEVGRFELAVAPVG